MAHTPVGRHEDLGHDRSGRSKAVMSWSVYSRLAANPVVMTMYATAARRRDGERNQQRHGGEQVPVVDPRRQEVEGDDEHGSDREERGHVVSPSQVEHHPDDADEQRAPSPIAHVWRRPER